MILTHHAAGLRSNEAFKHLLGKRINPFNFSLPAHVQTAACAWLRGPHSDVFPFMLSGSLVVAAGDPDSEQQQRQVSSCSEDSDLVRKSYNCLLHEQTSSRIYIYKFSIKATGYNNELSIKLKFILQRRK